MFIGENDRGIVVIFDFEHPHEIEFCIGMVESLLEQAPDEETRAAFQEALARLEKYKRGTLQ